MIFLKGCASANVIDRIMLISASKRVAIILFSNYRKVVMETGVLVLQVLHPCDQGCLVLFSLSIIVYVYFVLLYSFDYISVHRGCVRTPRRPMR